MQNGAADYVCGRDSGRTADEQDGALAHQDHRASVSTRLRFSFVIRLNLRNLRKERETKYLLAVDRDAGCDTFNIYIFTYSGTL